VVPPVDLQFAVDVLDDHHSVLHRIGCTEYAQDRFGMIIIKRPACSLTPAASRRQRAGRRLLLAALRPIDEDDDEVEDFVVPARETA
jgi:hypothetical protein